MLTLGHKYFGFIACNTGLIQGMESRRSTLPADILVCHLPAEVPSGNSISAEALKQLKRGAGIIFKENLVFCDCYLKQPVIFWVVKTITIFS